MYRADKTSIAKVIEIFNQHFLLKSEDYESMKVNQIIISYHIFSEDYIETRLSPIQKDEILTRNSITKQNLIHSSYSAFDSIFKIPLIFIGEPHFVINILQLNENISLNNKSLYKLILNKINDKEYEIKITDQKNILKYRFVDKLTSEYMIERSCGNNTDFINLIKSEVLLTTKQDINKNNGFITSIKKDEKLKIYHLRKFITLDFETIKDKNMENFNHIPVLLGYYDFYINKKGYSLLLNDSNNKIISILEKFLTKEYNGYKIYAHNLGLFDSIFILKNLVKLSERVNIKIEPLFRDRKLICIKVKYGYNSKKGKYLYELEFKDSLLMLLAPLSKLIKFFITEDPMLNKYKDNSKEIIDKLLSSESREHMQKDEFRRDLINYCLNDCKSLAVIVYKFSVLIYDLYKINVHKYPTLSSLAFAIFRTHYLKNDQLIPKISGTIYKNIQKAYTGGHVDVYKMYSDKSVHSYDFVSLYPSVMYNNEFPVGKMTHFVGNILNEELKYTIEDLIKSKSFVRCDIYVDKSINRPVYQTHLKINKEIRTVCATGTFLDQWVYLPELIEYQKLTNNLIRIIPDSIKEGYLFESKNIFKEYVESLFEMKKSVTKSDPKYMISKILMNSLYGRFGLKQEIQIFDFIDNQLIESFINGKNIKDVIELS
uniref:DNA polymerase n=1 Tax=Amanita sinensis TaxID=67728 RepID=UPI001D0FA3A8|nr:DNA polymerase [Amanita sinensis]QZN08162.1 DNA polymerase [Amanita sinensis]